MKLSLLTLQRVQEKGKVEILLANETVFTVIAEGTGGREQCSFGNYECVGPPPPQKKTHVADVGRIFAPKM